MLEYVGGILRDYAAEHGINANNEEHPPVRTRLLHSYIEQRGVVDRINLFRTHINTNNIVALVQKSRQELAQYGGLSDVADIYFAENQNYCWRRFGVCKEMYHCMIDKSDGDRVANLENIRTLLELLTLDTTVLTGDFQPLDREQEAELLALETLFPVEFRQKYLTSPITDLNEYQNLAFQFKIPVEYARAACQPHYIKVVSQRRGGLLAL